MNTIIATLPHLLMTIGIVFATINASRAAEVATNHSPVERLQRVPALAPEQSRQAIQIRSGFQVELVAAEPLVRSPIAIDFDEDGRMYVVEYPEYNDYAATRPHGHGAIRRLEDRDGDGRYEHSIYFAENVPFASGVLCYHGGVFVAAAPDLLFLKDTNGDGKADVRERILTGFERDHSGEAMLNGLRWGLDQNVHLSSGLAGGTVRRADGKMDQPRSVRNMGVAFDPRTRDWWITGGAGQYGMCFDDWGRKFASSNASAAWQVMYDNRYVARNPVVVAPGAGVVIVPGGKYTQLFRISPVEQWRIAREALRQRQNSSREQGITSNIFTSATGAMVYRGDAYPAKCRGQYFVGEVANNLVYRARLEPDGYAFKALRADPNTEFLASRDNWFRPVQITGGPDGCLYVVDMYRELIEGADFLPDELLKQLDPSGGVDRGRIYRIVPDGFHRPATPRLSLASTAELVALLASTDGWHRDVASRLLVERRAADAVAPLHKLAQQSDPPLARVHALYVLAALGELHRGEVTGALAAPQPEVREQAVVLAEQFAGQPDLLAALGRLTDDPAIRVRCQLAFSLWAFDGPAADDALVRLAKRDAANTWVNLAIRCSANGARADKLVARLVADSEFARSTPGRALLAHLTQQISAANQGDCVDRLLQIVEKLPAAEDGLAQSLVQRVMMSRPITAGDVELPPKSRRLWRASFESARRVATDAKQKLATRQSSIQLLAFLSFPEARATFAALLEPGQDEQVQTAVFDRIARYREPEVSDMILAAWPNLSVPVRGAAVDTLLERRPWTEALFGAIERGKIARNDVDPARVQLLYLSSDPKIRHRTTQVFGSPVTQARAEVVANYREALSMSGDIARGKAVFRARCTACHRLEDSGRALGADLAAVGDRGAASVLLNILDPNREVKPNYQVHTLVTVDGRILTGLVSGETATAVTVHLADGAVHTILRKDIEDLQNTGRSFMPEGLEKQIAVPEMADLLAYLLAKK